MKNSGVIEATITIKAPYATPLLTAMIARVLMEHGAAVMGLDKESMIAMKVPKLQGLLVTMKYAKNKAKRQPIWVKRLIADMPQK